MRKQLSAMFVKNVTRPGKYGDLHGLILQVRPTGSKYWFWRGTVRGKRMDLGIGPFPYVSLAEARQTAFEFRRASKRGQDPRGQRACPSLADAAEEVIRLHRRSWKTGGKTEEQWRTELDTYILPRLGRRPVDEITPTDILTTLAAGNLWTRKPSVAKRQLTRLGTIMKWSVAEGHRSDDPTTAVSAALPKQNGRKQHYRALPHQELPRAIRQVWGSKSSAVVKLAFELLVLTAVRTIEVRFATWDEIDLEARTWTIPAERMKAKREHRIPLSDRALEILHDAAARFGPDGLLFPGADGGPLHPTTISSMIRRQGIPATPHGSRSSFRDWCASEGVDRTVAEASLAHTVQGVEGAYLRTTVFERRRRLMQGWADYLAT